MSLSAAWRAIPGGLGAGIEGASNAVKELMDMPMLDPVQTPLKLATIKAHLADSASAAASEGAAGASGTVEAGFTNEPGEPQQDISWIEIELVHKTGQPMANKAYDIIGRGEEIIRSENLDRIGQAHASPFELGTYNVSFPSLDEADREGA